MKLPEISVKRPVTTAMIMGIVVVIGVVSFFRLGLDLLPDIDYPVVSVITSFPGASPEDVESLLTRPMEQMVSTVNRVKSVRSISQEGASVVLVEFEWGTNLDFAAQDIRNQIGLYKQYLPDDASEPLVVKFNIAQMPILGYGIVGPMEPRELHQFVDESIARRLERIDGVASAVVQSSQQREIEIEISRPALQSRGLSLNDVVNALRAANLNLPAGYLVEGHNEFRVRSFGEYQSLEDIGSTIVGASSTGKPIYLRDVAVVRDGYRDVRLRTRVQGQNGVFLAISKQSGANSVTVARKVKREVEELKNLLPPGSQMYVAWDMSEMIERITSRTSNNALVGGLLAIFMVYLFLRNWRPTLAIALAIPLSILATFIALYYAGYTLNMLTLSGLALGVGMLVDNAVVVIENIFRHLEEGEDRQTAAILGAGEVGMAITASTLTTVAVFFPMVFAGGIAGQLSKGLALTIAFSLFASLFVSLTLVPTMASFVFREKDVREKLGRVTHGRFIDALRNRYEKQLRLALRHRWRLISLSFAAFLVALVGTAFLGAEFMPKMDQTMALIRVRMPVGTSLEETDRIVQQAERVTMGLPEVRTLVTTVGLDEENALDLAGGNAPQGPNEGFVYLRLRPKRERKRSSEEILETLRGSLPKIQGAKIEALDMSGQFLGQETLSPIQIKVFGKDLDRLREVAETIARRVSTVPGIRDVDVSIRQSKPEYRLVVDRERASRLGLPVAVVADAVQTATVGKVASRYRHAGEEVNMRVKFVSEDRDALTDILNIPLKTPLGRQVLLGEVVRVERTRGPIQITRESQSRVVSVTANIYGRDLGSVVRDIRRELRPIESTLPSGYFIEIGGQYDQLQEVFKWLAAALSLSLLLVFMVMASQFESLRHPFVIMFTIPLAYVGVVFGLGITGQTLSLPAFMGILILTGIAVNNGIVMIDYINQLRRKGLDALEAIVRGASTRLRPILITALTTIIGMVPMALGRSEGVEFRRPMAVAVIFGLTFTTFLTLFVVPSIYAVLERVRVPKES
ncbi:MAG: efflux RND transporter permease subunit [candidate division KSB1 bacterium]|nr:efflux RND transporter permease subunit [candidate division KSB1 bacterium]